MKGAQGRHGKLKEMTDNDKRIAEAWPALLASISAGDMVRDALKAAGITRHEVHGYMKRHPAMRVEWDDAREASADAFMDEALDVARSKTDDASHARTRVDTLKWAARIRNPRAYSDKSSIDVNVKTVDLTAIIRDANARLAAAAQGRVIDGTYNRVADGVHAHAQTLLSPELAALL